MAAYGGSGIANSWLEMALRLWRGTVDQGCPRAGWKQCSRTGSILSTGPGGKKAEMLLRRWLESQSVKWWV